MDKTFVVHMAAAVGAALLFAGTAMAEDKAVDWNALQATKISLGKGLSVGATKGKPISGKFEVEDGKLQLSVYTASKGKFSEIIVDHMNGKISKSEQIKEGEDYSEAVAQNKAMAKAKRSLSAAVGKALGANPGYRAVSVVPSLQQGKPVATVLLENSTRTKTVSEKLD